MNLYNKCRLLYIQAVLLFAHLFLICYSGFVRFAVWVMLVCIIVQLLCCMCLA